MSKFKYVTKKEYQPVKQELINLINLVQDEVREYFTFRYDFIGSASRNMITIDEKSNIGYDFDINLRVNDDEENYTAQEIKEILINGFNKYNHLFKYDYCEDSKRVITIKVKDRTNSRILHSCDFAVVYDCDDGRQQYIHFNKTKQQYEWQYQPNGFSKIKEKVEEIKKNGFWQKVRDLYIEKKNNNNNPNKKSRSIFAEVISEVYMKYIEKDD
ncbi:MAG: hypothetical protein IJD50_05325 [Clostridia bacterium]|nr:hypothetical protein [Clostridia bacterium]